MDLHLIKNPQYKTRPALLRLIYALTLVLLSHPFANAGGAAQHIEINLQKNLRSEHPRLIFTKADQLRIEALAKQEPLLQKLINMLFVQADQLLSEPVITYTLPGTRPRLLGQSRACLAKILTLATAYRLSSDQKYANRAIKEMDTAIHFPDWNPSHFLDVGEMSTAMAIGYDWLYDVLSDEDKIKFKTALIKYALEPGMTVHPDRFRNKFNNWNFVCNGGLIITALAIGDEEPFLAEQIIGKGFDSLPNALKSYAPDGAWFEGPSYWYYGTNYLTMLLSSLESALGSDYGFSEYPGLDNTGRFFVDTIGPSGQFFNYADCGLYLRGSAPALLWLARRFNQPLLTWHDHQMTKNFLDMLTNPSGKKNYSLYHHRLFALEIIWFEPDHDFADIDPPLDSYYRGLNDVAFFRSSWQQDAFWVGLKAGKNSVNHAHLDCGSFVFESQGQRWAEDLGSDNYNLPGYFDRTDGGRRWHYFRTSSLSHNVPTINGQNQVFDGNTKIIAFHSSPERAHAVVDLSSAYAGQAESVMRGLALVNRNTLLIQDESVGLNKGDTFRWAMLTSANITLMGKIAELQIDDKVVVAEIVQPIHAVFDTSSTKPSYHPDENPNTGTRLLTVSIAMTKENKSTLVIRLKPKGIKPNIQAEPIKVTPLSEWIGYLEDKSL